MPELQSIELVIPAEKAFKCSWLLNQPPEVRADAIGMCEVLWENVQRLAKEHKFDESVKTMEKMYDSFMRSHKDEIEAIREAHSKEVVVLHARMREITTNSFACDSTARRGIEEQFSERLATNERMIHEHMQREKWYMDELKESNRLKTQIALECKDEIARIQDQQSSLISGLRSSASVGQVGENLVHSIFSGLNLGDLQDTAKQADKGDALWKMGTMKCLVEVKLVAHNLSASKDIEKFWSNVKTGARSGRINAALIISLCARIQGKRKIDIQLHNGILVVFASREYASELQPSELITMAFHVMSSLWPLFQVEVADSSGIDVDIFSRQIQEMAKRIDSLEKLSASLQKEASALRKIRSDLISSSGIDM